MYFLKCSRYLLIEVVKIRYQLYEAQVDQRIFPTQNITIFLYLTLIPLNFVLQL